MAAPSDSFQDWLDGFRKEVDAVIAGSSPNVNPAAGQAQAAFENWWQTNQTPLSAELPPAGGPADEIAHKMQSLLEEKLALEKKVWRGEQEIAALRDAAGAVQTELAQAKVQASRDCEHLESQASKLDTQLRALQEQVKSLKENKSFLEESFGRMEGTKSKAEEDLRLERERALLSASENLSLKHKTVEQEAALAKLREAVASRDGTLEELRRQASAYQERLITAKELTDTDVAALRQELKFFLEECRIMINTVRKGEQR
jgi:chromosome segregation ATPase